MKISIIVAMSLNRVIGVNNQLPWKLSADMAWFKKQTMNKTLLLGRKTWESLPLRPLPGRQHIILSNNKNYRPLDLYGQPLKDIKVVSSVEDAIKVAQETVELMVIGGATIYELMLPFCDKLYITQVNNNYEGDAWFPEFDPSVWYTNYKEHYQADEKNHSDFDFIIMEKIK